jgi:hypothetical protein
VVRRVKVLEAAVEQTLRMKQEQLDQLSAKQKQVKKLEKGPERETRKEAKWSEDEQPEKEAAEAGEPEADLMEDGRGERSREQSKESVKRILRDRTIKERLGSMAPLVAGETSAAVVTGAHRLSPLAGYTIPRAVSPIAMSYIETLPFTLHGCIIRAPETVEEKVLCCLGSWRMPACYCPAQGRRATPGCTSNFRRRDLHKKPGGEDTRERITGHSIVTSG